MIQFLHEISIYKDDMDRLIALGKGKTKLMDNIRKGPAVIFREDRDIVGVIPEFAFAEAYGPVFGVKMNWNPEAHPAGDGGIDYIVNGWTVDAKYLEDYYRYITVQQYKSKADIYVWCRYDKYRQLAILLGFEFGKIMETMPTDEFGKGQKPAHRKNRDLIRSMDDLDKLFLFGKKEYSIEQHLARISPKRVLLTE